MDGKEETATVEGRRGASLSVAVAEGSDDEWDTHSRSERTENCSPSVTIPKIPSEPIINRLKSGPTLDFLRATILESI